MANPHCSITPFSRKGGMSAVARAGYRYGARMQDELRGKTFDYSGKAKEVVHTEIAIPANAPSWLRDELLAGKDGDRSDRIAASERLWSALDMVEETSKHSRRDRALVFREVTVSLPNELSMKENLELTRSFVERTFTARGMVADWAIHNPKRAAGEPANPHVHIMVATRSIGVDGWGHKHRDFDRASGIRSIRFEWAQETNLAYERAGLDIRIDHRTLKDQGIELEPVGHNPYIAAAAEKAGKVAFEKTLDMEARAENERRLIERPERIIALISQRQRVFSAEDIRAALEKRITAEPDLVASSLAIVLSSQELVIVGKYGKTGAPLYTSQVRITQERALVDQAVTMAGERLNVGTVDGHDLPSEGLKETQRLAAEAMLSPERLTLVTGFAGTGKTHTIGKVAKVWRDRGFAVYGGAGSGKATQELNGIVGMEAGTLAAWEARWSRGLEMPKGNFVFFMDEAGMVGGDVWSRIQDQVSKAGGKFIAVGDPEQLAPVGDSSPFASLQGKIGVTVMNEVIRHESMEDREATAMFAMGGDHAARAIRHYAKTGCVTFVESVDGAIGAIADRYFDGTYEAKERIALALSNSDVNNMNGALRAKGKLLGHIGEIEFSRGAVPRVERTADGGEKRVFVDLVVSQGDRLIFTKPFRAQGIPKSSLATVLEASETEMLLAVDGRGKPVRIAAEEFNSFDYGFATTVHKSQGMTVDKAFVLGHGYMNQHLIYVGMSRHRIRTEFFAPTSRIKTIKDLEAIARTKGYLTIDALEGKPHVSMTQAAAELADVQARPDKRAMVSLGRVNFEGDPHLMGVSSRIAGLLSADYIDGDPIFIPEADRHFYYNRDKIVDDIISRKSAFTAEDVASYLTKVIQDPDTFIDSFEAAMSHPDLVVIDHEASAAGQRLYSTKAQVALEMRVVDRGVRLAMTGQTSVFVEPRLSPKISLGRSSFQIDRGLSDRQMDLIGNVLQRQGLTLVSGPSGSGKTRVAAAIAEQISRNPSQTAIIIAPTGAAVEALRLAGAQNPMTINQYEARVEHGSLRPDASTTLVLDDAGLVDARTADRLLEHVEARGARLIALRDTDQFLSYGAGPAFEMIEARVGSYALTETWRQLDPDMKRALDNIGLRAGTSSQPVAGVRHLVETGVVHAGESLHKSLNRLADDYVKDQALSKIALAPSKVQAGLLNERIRARLDGLIADRLETAVEAAAPGSIDALRKGDKIKLIAAYKEANLRPGTVVEVLSRNADSVLLRATTSDASELTLRLRGNPEDFQYRFAFAETVHAVKGRDIDSVHMLATAGLNRTGLYTGMALHRQALNVIVPTSAEFLSKTVEAIVSTEALRQGALDFTLDTALAAREVTRNQIQSPNVERLTAGLAAIKSVLGIDPQNEAQHSLPRGVVAEGLSEVIAGHIIDEAKAPDLTRQAEYVAILEKVANKPSWKAAQRLTGEPVGQASHKHAVERAGVGSQGKALPVAVALSRAATLATALGQPEVADRFHRALDVYSLRADALRKSVGIEAIEAYVPRGHKSAVDPMPSPAMQPRRSYQSPSYGRRAKGLSSLVSLAAQDEVSIMRALLSELVPSDFVAGYMEGRAAEWDRASPRSPSQDEKANLLGTATKAVSTLTPKMPDVKEARDMTAVPNPAMVLFTGSNDYSETLSDGEKLQIIARAQFKAKASHYNPIYVINPDRIEQDFPNDFLRREAKRNLEWAERAQKIMLDPEAYENHITTAAKDLEKAIGQTLPIFTQIVAHVKSELDVAAAKFRQDYEDNPALLRAENPDPFTHNTASSRQNMASKAKTILASPKLLQREIFNRSLAIAESLKSKMQVWEDLTKEAVKNIEQEAQAYDPSFPDAEIVLAQKYPEAKTREHAVKEQAKAKRAVDILASRQGLSQEVFKRTLTQAKELGRSVSRGLDGFGY